MGGRDGRVTKIGHPLSSSATLRETSNNNRASVSAIMSSEDPDLAVGTKRTARMASDKDILANLSDDYFNESYNAPHDILSDLPSDITVDMLTQQLREAIRAQEIVGERLNARVLSNYSDFVQGMTQVANLQSLMAAASEECGAARRALKGSADNISTVGLSVVRIQRRKHRLMDVYEILDAISAASRYRKLAAEYAAQGEFAKALRCVSDGRKALVPAASTHVASSLQSILTEIHQSCERGAKTALVALCGRVLHLSPSREANTPLPIEFEGELQAAAGAIQLISPGTLDSSSHCLDLIAEGIQQALSAEARSHNLVGDAALVQRAATLMGEALGIDASVLSSKVSEFTQKAVSRNLEEQSRLLFRAGSHTSSGTRCDELQKVCEVLSSWEPMHSSLSRALHQAASALVVWRTRTCLESLVSLFSGTPWEALSLPQSFSVASMPEFQLEIDQTLQQLKDDEIDEREDHALYVEDEDDISSKQGNRHIQSLSEPLAKVKDHIGAVDVAMLSTSPALHILQWFGSLRRSFHSCHLLREAAVPAILAITDIYAAVVFQSFGTALASSLHETDVGQSPALSAFLSSCVEAAKKGCSKFASGSDSSYLVHLLSVSSSNSEWWEIQTDGIRSEQVMAAMESIQQVAEGAEILCDDLRKVGVNAKSVGNQPNALPWYVLSHKHALSTRANVMKAFSEWVLEAGGAMFIHHSCSWLTSMVAGEKWDRLQEESITASPYTLHVNEALQSVSAWLNAGDARFTTATEKCILNRAFINLIWQGVCRALNRLLVHAFGNVKKCSEGGRLQMLMDVNAFESSLLVLSGLKPVPFVEYSKTYVRAYWLDESDMEKWIATHLEYPEPLVLSLINVGIATRISKKAKSEFLKKVSDLYPK
jgi:hypothetical protein